MISTNDPSDLSELDALSSCNQSTPFFQIINESHPAKVVKCYDGDTVHCVFKFNGNYYKFRIRLCGYNSPELRPSKKIPKEQRNEIIRKAKLAKLRLKDLCLNKIVHLECHGFDNFGRILGVLKLNFDDDLSINQVMLAEGHGVEFLG